MCVAFLSLARSASTRWNCCWGTGALDGVCVQVQSERHPAGASGRRRCQGSGPTLLHTHCRVRLSTPRFRCFFFYYFMLNIVSKITSCPRGFVRLFGFHGCQDRDLGAREKISLVGCECELANAMRQSDQFSQRAIFCFSIIIFFFYRTIFVGVAGLQFESFFCRRGRVDAWNSLTRSRIFLNAP